MTTLDEKAKAAAWDAYCDRGKTSGEHLEAILRAYLDALPPAKRAWGLRERDGTVAPIAEISERAIQDYSLATQTPVEIEIREVGS